jgi:hypothetical protein
MPPSANTNVVAARLEMELAHNLGNNAVQVAAKRGVVVFAALEAVATLQARAANSRRPTILLLPWQHSMFVLGSIAWFYTTQLVLHNVSVH